MSYAQQSITPPSNAFAGPDEVDPSGYAEARAQWRMRQTDTDIRALAYEWKIGLIDDCTEDAWLEYQHRFAQEGSSTRGPHQEFTVKAQPGRRKRDMQRRKR